MACSDFLLFLLRALLWIYDVITFPIYACIYRTCGRRADTAHAAKKARVVSRSQGEITYRCIPIECRFREELIRHPNNINTLAKVFNFMVTKYGNRLALGTRQILEEKVEVNEQGKKLNKVVLGRYLWLKYTDFAELSDQFGRGIRGLGVAPRQRVCMFADTRAEWLIAAVGCFKNSIAIATIYTNLGVDGIEHGVTQTQAEVMVTSQELLPKVLNLLERLPNLKTIVYFESQLKDRPELPKGINIRLYSYTDVITMGAKSTVANADPEPEDTAIIMYTSGSTGVPKGVVITHNNMVNAMLSLLPLATKGIEAQGAISTSDTYIAFLPLAHVLELLAEHLVLLLGIKIGYSSPFTLTDKSTAVVAGGTGDATVLKPTIMAVVPLILDRIYKGINKNIAQKGPFAKKLIDFCVAYKMRWVARGFDTPIMNKIIFSKMKDIIGGRLRLMLSGGAPLADDAHEFIRTCLSTKLVQGYGLTETCSTGSISDPFDLTTGHVGAPLEGVDLKLVDWEEGGYTVRDVVGPRGEIVMGGAHIAAGYFNMPEKTKEEFYMEDGKHFFKTGDIGQILPDGSVKIIDRKKDLVKLQAGEYVSLGKVESNLKISPIVENICVYANSLHSATVALVVPEDERLNELAKEMGRGSGLPREQLCKDPNVTKAVLDQLAKLGVSCKLEKFEIPKRVTLISELWTPDTGLVTAAFKLRRKPIQQRYQKELDGMYDSLRNEGAIVLPMEIENKRENKNGKKSSGGNKVGAA